MGTPWSSEFTNNMIVGHYDLEDFLDINLDDSGHEDSAIKQTFEARAGDLLSFDWNMLTSETGALEEGFYSQPYPDTAFVVINDQITTLMTAGDGFDKFLGHTLFFNSNTPFELESDF